MFKQGDSSNRQKLNGCSFQQIFTAKFVLVFILTKEDVLLQEFYFKVNKRAQVPLNDGTRDFQNNPLFERSAYFYVKITGDFGRF